MKGPEVSTSELDLNDTQVAFRSRSKADLIRARILFTVIGNPTISAVGGAVSRFALAIGLPIKGLIKQTIFRQFVGGETVEETMPIMAKLAESGVGSILDHSVEGQDSEADLDHTCEEILRTVRISADNAHIPFCVFKLTGIARNAVLEQTGFGVEEFERVKNRVLRICQAAYDADTPVLIDAEESWLQHTIDAFAWDMMMRFNKDKAIVYNTIQLYRHDRLAFLHTEILRAQEHRIHYGVKLVRGAYMEKERRVAEEKGLPSPIHADKEAVDRDYDKAVVLCLDNLATVALLAGTHNQLSCEKLADLMIERGIDRKDPRVYFSQLYGMSDQISFNLSHAGFNVAKYVPYGPVKKVLPYLLRRAKENTSVSGQTGRELSLIKEELERRKR
jgi:proline dehydrogenase